MGSHSPESKRKKRRKQKLRKRNTFATLSHSDKGHGGNSDIQSSSGSVPSQSIPNEGFNVQPSSDSVPSQSDSNEDFWAALDKIGERNLEYWEQYRDSLESFKDVHPAIVCDKDNRVDVYVKGAHKGTEGLARVDIEHYFTTMHKRQETSQRMCIVLRNRIDELESLLQDAKVEMEKVKEKITPK